MFISVDYLYKLYVFIKFLMCIVIYKVVDMYIFLTFILANYS